MGERFRPMWPVAAALIHIVDFEAEHPHYGWRSMCRKWLTNGDDWITLQPGDEHNTCATCTKIRARREKKES